MTLALGILFGLTLGLLLWCLYTLGVVGDQLKKEKLQLESWEIMARRVNERNIELLEELKGKNAQVEAFRQIAAGAKEDVLHLQTQLQELKAVRQTVSVTPRMVKE